LINGYHLSADQVPDAHLAAIALEHGLEIHSADTDFARFTEVRWVKPDRGVAGTVAVGILGRP
jgi:hypothetical protein